MKLYMEIVCEYFASCRVQIANVYFQHTYSMNKLQWNKDHCIYDWFIYLKILILRLESIYFLLVFNIQLSIFVFNKYIITVEECFHVCAAAPICNDLPPNLDRYMKDYLAKKLSLNITQHVLHYHYIKDIILSSSWHLLSISVAILNFSYSYYFSL